MNSFENESDEYLIGWDVGGWDCDRNRNSRDALVILEAGRRLVGRPWRGNLRHAINEAASGEHWLELLFALCEATYPGEDCPVVLAVDAPLAFSRGFCALIGEGAAAAAGSVPAGDNNPYLYREAESYLMARGHRPLSPVKDMIGSQSTKAMHVLARFTHGIERTGVWIGDNGFRVIEAYPSVARKSPRMGELLAEQAVAVTGERRWPPKFEHTDQVDALICALVAWLFVHDPGTLVPPAAGIPASEGWIWFPEDALE